MLIQISFGQNCLIFLCLFQVRTEFVNLEFSVFRVQKILTPCLDYKRTYYQLSRLRRKKQSRTTLLEIIAPTHTQIQKAD